ncbi:MAG: glycosyltransferase family 4 protein [Anaerolineales bacterium]|nr:glycosyltransferase family 4 protein [Anaerolineales bacterium]
MKVLVSLTYYRPHVSGLTIYAERLSRALAARGHAVTVLTSQYDRALPRRECLHGVDIIRVPVLMRVSKGVIMPTIGWEATRLVPAHDVLSLHLPQLDATGLAVRGRLFRRPVVVTYHSDLILPRSPINWLAQTVSDLGNDAVARLADRLVAYTDDFARHSRYLSKHLDKVTVIPPPVEMPTPSLEAIQAFRERHHLNGSGPVIGLAVRLAAEKGVEYLLEALPRILERYPRARVLHAGPREAIGEAAYLQKLEQLIDGYRDRYTFVGTLDAEQMAVFFSNCDVHVLPSINNTETFGLVQIEAALSGTPTVASALPGVRMPTRMTGMGLSVPPRDPAALAEAILDVLARRGHYVRPRGPIAAQFAPAATAAQYEQIFTELLAARRKA